jgi:hypothetical protein
LTLLETDTFWLSNTPFEPGSRFPGAGCARLATFALFRLSSAPSEKDPREIALINTHLDHVSDAQRRMGASMVLHRARYEACVRPEVPLFVAGDLNRRARIFFFSLDPSHFFIECSDFFFPSRRDVRVRVRFCYV